MMESVIDHVEKIHREKEFLVFMTAEDFFDFLRKKCHLCDFLYLDSSAHSDLICQKYQKMKAKHNLTNFEITRVLQKMVNGSLLVKPGVNDKNPEDSEKEKPQKKNQKKRKRSHKEKKDGSSSATDGYEADSHMEDGSSDEGHVPLIKRQRLQQKSELYLRCPATKCGWKTLRPNNPTDFSDILNHMRSEHTEGFIIFNQTKMAHSKVQCPKCDYWFESEEKMKDHEPYCHANVTLNSSYEITDRMDKIFDMNILNVDFGYEFSGKFSSPKLPQKGDKKDLIERYADNFWKECPVEGCDYVCEKGGMHIFAMHLGVHPVER